MKRFSDWMILLSQVIAILGILFVRNLNRRLTTIERSLNMPHDRLEYNFKQP